MGQLLVAPLQELAVIVEDRRAEVRLRLAMARAEVSGMVKHYLAP
jgi:hypothetical protein